MLTLQALTYIERNDQTDGSIWNYATETLDILERVLNWMALSNSAVGMCTPMKVIKQPKHERT